jgi:WD40 repeat protein
MEESAKGIDFLNSPHESLGKDMASIQHCDIKPENIMLTGNSVMICDFGVARVLADPQVAATGTSMAGSPAYMAPESIARKPCVTTDQYALAITYYELRTGKLPFQSETWADVFDAHRSGNLDLSSIPAAEQEVIRKATSVNPTDRYPSTVAMVRALRRVIEHDQPVAASGGKKWVYPILAVAAMAVAIGLTAYVLTAIKQGDGQQTGGTEPQDVLRQITLHVQPSDAEVLVDGTSQELDASGNVDLRRAPDETIEVVVRKPPEYKEVREEVPVSSITDAPYEIRLVRSPDHTASAYADRAWQQLTGGPLTSSLLDDAADEYQRALELEASTYATVPPVDRILGTEEGQGGLVIRALAWNDQRRWLATRGASGRLMLWKLQDEEVPGQMVDGHAGIINLAMGGDFVATANLSETITVSQLGESGRPGPPREIDELGGFELAITADGQRLVAGDNAGTVRVLDLSTLTQGGKPRTLGQHNESVTALILTPDGRYAVTAGFDDRVIKWDLDEARRPSQQLGQAEGDVVCLAVCPDGRNVAYAGEAQREGRFYVTAVDLETNMAEPLSLEHSESISALAFDKSGRWLASGSRNGDVQVWSRQARTLAVPQGRHEQAVRCLAFCPLEGWLVTGGEDGNVGLWNVASTSAAPMFMPGRNGRVVSVVVTDKWIIAGCENGRTLLWDLRRCLLVKQAADRLGIELAPSMANPGAIIKT